MNFLNWDTTTSAFVGLCFLHSSCFTSFLPDLNPQFVLSRVSMKDEEH